MYYVTLLDSDGCEMAAHHDISGLKDAKAIAKQYLTDPEYQDAKKVEVRDHGTAECVWDQFTSKH